MKHNVDCMIRETKCNVFIHNIITFFLNSKYNMKIIKETCYKGTRIILGNKKPHLIQKCREYLVSHNFVEIQIPIIQLSTTFENKVGIENNNMMYNFTDRGNRKLSLAPEYTSIIQKLAKTQFKHQKDLCVFYVAECFRGEKPQKGRFRQFTQLGIEVINPTINFRLTNKAIDLCEIFSKESNFILNENTKRGLDYYKNGKGFEIICNELGSSKQVCGGGAYDGGEGFAIGVDRLLEL